MALCTSSFPANFSRAVALDLHKHSSLTPNVFLGTDLYSQFQHKLNQVKKRPSGVYASLSQREEYHSQRPPTPLLDTINYPIHMKNVSIKELKQLSNELRSDVIFNVSKTGGHLGSSLGVVELTVALHYVFSAPQDRILWDVGHQSYPHKILTGRRDKMHTIRQTNGLSGFTKRSESEYDCFGTGHSSTTISAGLGNRLSCSTYCKTEIRTRILRTTCRNYLSFMWGHDCSGGIRLDTSHPSQTSQYVARASCTGLPLLTNYHLIL
ncbi:hypothetical protein LOK49_LG06G03179 [Camellia lanceoleosa]|uniref:Uncharacterized protein n=1 Tax=Camellia lanceoleosa TaxID=1840588 RepID=A0ACC0HD04_9ERIC|nr:hypothetical protein LOK49_LG06G03179 [Camellia lanceoleosa]